MVRSQKSLRDEWQQTVQVKLNKPTPLLILYNTAVVVEDSEVRFFDDIYGQDAVLERELTSKLYRKPRTSPRR